MNESDAILAIDELHRAANGIPIRNLWYMLLYAWNETRVKHRWNAAVESAPTLDALLAAILAASLSQRLRIGLAREYRVDDAFINGIRGRVDFAESLRTLSFEQGKAYCRFQTFSANVLKNQIIRSTLARLVLIGEFGTHCDASRELTHRLRGLVRALDMVDLIDLDPELIRREQSKRHDSDYRLMLAICGLIAQREMPMETGGRHELPHLDRDAMTLWRIFEVFIANFYRAMLKDWMVTAQPHWRWHATIPSRYLPALKPDIVLTHTSSGKVVVLDTKFTAGLLTTGQWGNATFDSHHLFQMYAYLRSQEHASEQHRCAEGVLLYPAVGTRHSEMAELQGHRIHWETIDLSTDWETIESMLLGLADR